MKTLEKTKQGLECCTLNCDGSMYTDCSHCPYYLTCDHCDLEMHADALAYIQQLEAEVPKWISVEERLPENGIYQGCLVFVPALDQFFVADWSHDKNGNDWWFYVDGEYEPLATHWMPLPEPPTWGVIDENSK